MKRNPALWIFVCTGLLASPTEASPRPAAAERAALPASLSSSLPFGSDTLDNGGAVSVGTETGATSPKPKASPNGDTAEPAAATGTEPPETSAGSSTGSGAGTANPAASLWGSTPGASDTSTPDPGSTGPGAAGGGSGKASPPARGIWIWQGDGPVEEKTKSPSRGLRPWRLNGGNAIHANGYAGFGITSSVDTFNNENSGGSRDFLNKLGELGVLASGIIFDRSLLTYSINAQWQRNSNTYTQFDSVNTGLNYGVQLGFLASSRFPFTVYAQRSTNDGSGNTLTPFTYLQNSLGVQGTAKMFGRIAYNLSKTDSDTDSVQFRIDNHLRNANVAFTRNLFGFDLDAGDQYTRSESNFSRTVFSNHYSQVGLSRDFGRNMRLDLRAARGDYELRNLGQTLGTNSTIDSVNGIFHWAMSSRLDTTVNVGFTDNSVNFPQIITAATGSPVVANPLAAASLDALNKNISGTVGVAIAEHLAANFHVAYNSSSLPALSLAGLSEAERARLSTGSLTERVSLNYSRRLWNTFTGQVSFQVGPQQYMLANGGSDTGLNSLLSAGISGGSDQSVAFSANYGYTRNSNPVFFSVFHSNQQDFNLNLRTRRFRFAELSGQMRIGRYSNLSQPNDAAHQDNGADVRSFSVQAIRPRFDAYFSYMTNNATSRLIALESLLTQPVGGPVLLPGNLLLPTAFNGTSTLTFGGRARPLANLQVESRYQHSNYAFNTALNPDYTSWSFDNSATYKFGRFDLTGGYMRLGSEGFKFNNSGRIIYFRVRFPFQIM